jgi:hypothetical protein
VLTTHFLLAPKSRKSRAIRLTRSGPSGLLRGTFTFLYMLYTCGRRGIARLGEPPVFETHGHNIWRFPAVNFDFAAFTIMTDHLKSWLQRYNLCSRAVYFKFNISKFFVLLSVPSVKCWELGYNEIGHDLFLTHYFQFFSQYFNSTPWNSQFTKSIFNTLQRNK